MQDAYVWEIGNSVLLGASATPSADLRKEEVTRGERATQVFSLPLTASLSRVIRQTLNRKYMGLSFSQAKELLMQSAIPDANRHSR